MMLSDHWSKIDNVYISAVVNANLFARHHLLYHSRNYEIEIISDSAVENSLCAAVWPLPNRSLIDELTPMTNRVARVTNW